MMEINISDLKGWDRFYSEFDHLVPNKETFNKALGAATQATSAWLKARAVRELSPILGIPPRVLFRRFKKFRLYGFMKGGKVWFGLDGIPFHLLNPVKSNKGAMTRDGRYYEEGAFVTKLQKTKRMIVLKRRDKTWGSKTGDKRQRGPVDVVRAPIEARCLLWLEAAIRHPSLEEKLYQRLEHELRWRLTQ